MKPQHIDKLVFSLEEEFDAAFTGIHDCSYHDLAYSEHKLKQSLQASWRWKKVQYMPFVYKGYAIWIINEDTVKRLPSLIVKQGRLL